MLPSALAVVLTAAFTVTGLVGARGLLRRRPAPCGEGRALCAVGVAMSLAMIVMAWAPTAGPASPGGLAQVVGFGAVALLLVAVAPIGRREAAAARLSHGLGAAAMAWMTATMPLLMGASYAGVVPAAEPLAPMPIPTPPQSAHHGHGAVEGATPAAAHGWASTVSLALVAVLVVLTVAWAVRAVQVGSPAHRARAATTVVLLPRRSPERVTAPALVAAGGAGGPVGSAAVTGAACHATMSLATALMLAAML